jgi:hypothetical protein
VSFDLPEVVSKDFKAVEFFRGINGDGVFTFPLVELGFE